MKDTKTATFLQEHPRLMGVLFTMTLLLTSSGSALAANGGTISG